MSRRNHSRCPEPGAVFSLTRRGAACVVSGLLATGMVLTVPVAIVSCKSEMAPLAEPAPPVAEAPRPVTIEAPSVRALPRAPVPPPSAPPPPAEASPPVEATEQEIWIIAKEKASEDVEHVIVTGSYIRRDSFDLPAPTDSIDELDLELSGTPDLGEQVTVNAKTDGPYRRFTARPPDARRHHVTVRHHPGSGMMVASFPIGDGRPGRRHVPLPLKHTAVNADIDAYISTVNVVQEYENPYDTKIEAVYVFPLPEKAAVSEFLMIIGDRTIRGIVREKEEAERIYQEARARGHQASLLKQTRPNIFEQKVANIEPGNAIDIDITYFHTLAYRDGWYSFVFPTVVGPRYNPPGHPDPVDAVRRGGASAGQGTPVEYLRPEERSGHDISINVRVDAGVEIEELKSTHRIDVERDGANATVRLKRGKTIPNRDFVLDFRVAGETLKSSLLTHLDPETGEGYFTLMAIPPASSESIARQPMELVFVMDCSGSMRGRPMHQAKDAVRAALDRLTPADTFQIIRFSDRASQFGAKPVRATERNLLRARRFVDMLQADGGTEMINGVKAALDFPHDPSRFRFVTFMTDGYIGNERDILAAVNHRIGASRIFSFGVGSSVNRYLMERMAEAGRGVVAYIGLNDSGRKVMDGFFDRVSHPALTDVEIDWGGMTATDVYPAKLPDLFVGRPLVVTGKFTGEATDVQVLGSAGGERHMLTAAEDADDDAGSSLAKVWARLRIADLANRQTWAGDPHHELRDAIRNTALEYQLVSNYTSFIAVDSSIRTAGGHGVTVHQAVPVPAGVRYDTTVD